MPRVICATVLLALSCASADAALLSRAGGLAYYDDVLNITWIADGNLAQTSGFDADGLMTWAEANDWVASLNAGSGYLGATDWRLPVVQDRNQPGCSGGDYAFDATDCGYNVDPTTGEMAFLFYTPVTAGLGNTSGRDTLGAALLCSVAGSPWCLSNRGPFANLAPSFYWYGTADASNTEETSPQAWFFNFRDGEQATANQESLVNALAVRPGDIAVVPVPAAAWLFGSALGVMGVLRRRAASVA